MLGALGLFGDSLKYALYNVEFTIDINFFVLLFLFLQVPKWAKESDTRSNIGPSEQAQPTNLPTAERSKSSSSGSGLPSFSGSGQADVSKAPSSAKLSVSGSQSGSLSGSSSSSSSTAPQSSSSSSTSPPTSSSSGSTSHSSGSSGDTSSKNQSSNPETKGGDSQEPPDGRDSHDDSRGAGQCEEEMDTNTSQAIPFLLQESVEHSSLEQPSQAEGTQDSFLRRKNDSSSLSSHGGGESGYTAGSSSQSTLASPSVGKGSLPSAPFVNVGDSQETVENSVSCIEDSAPLVMYSGALTKSLSNIPCVSKTDVIITRESKADSPSKCLMERSNKGASGEKQSGENLTNFNADQSNAELSSECVVLIEGHEGDNNKDETSELLPNESPQSPELLDDDVDTANDEDKMDTANSPEISLQAPVLPHSSTSPRKGITDNSTKIVDQVSVEGDGRTSQGNLEVGSHGIPISECSQAMDTDMVSTQSSFILQIADSQCSLAPVSPVKAGQRLEDDNDGDELSRNEGIVATPEEIEEYERDFPNLLATKQENESKPSAVPDPQVDAEKEVQISKEIDPINEPNSAVSKPVDSPVPMVADGSGATCDGGKDLVDASVRNKPVPLYESLVCDDSNSETVNQCDKGLIRIEDTAKAVNETMDTSQSINSGES